MNLHKILVPVDFSATDDLVIRLASTLARDTGASLIVMHVEEPPLAYGGGELYYGIPEPTKPDLRAMLERVVPTDPQIACEHRMVTGEPAAAVVELAKEENADLIVMGTHGRTGFSRVLMGSVAEAVVRRAPCPVLTWKHVTKQPAPAAK